MTPQQFLQFADLLPEPTLLVRGDGAVIAVNQAVASRLGVSSTEFNGRALAELLTESSDEVDEFLQKCARSRAMFLGAFTVRRDNRPDLPCRAEGAVLIPRQSNQEPVLLLRLLPKDATVGQFLALNEQIDKLGKEISRRRETEDALRSQKEWLQVTLESIGDAVIATSPSGQIVFMNRVAQSYVGYTESEARGLPLSDVFHIINEHTRQPVENPVAEVFRRGAIVGLANHTVLIDRHGVERPIEDSAAPIRDASGALMGIILVFHDVTDQRKAERELRKADRRKDEFLATLAHELRNPLAPVRNSLEILKRSSVDADTVVQQVHATMERQISHMVRLVDDLLDISRISRGKLVLRRSRVELASILYQALETCRPLAEDANHAVVVNLPSNPMFVDGDPVRLAQAFSNLLNNACKFTPRGGRIELTAHCEGDTVEVQVKDNGRGIPAEHLTTIFEIFSQVDSTLERTQGGLGIGLTLVKEVIELHGGSVEARSSGQGQGSQFTVQLPLLDAEVQTSAVRSEGHYELDPNSYRILVVDDNRDAAATLGIFLKLTGHETVLAFDGSEAVEAARQFQPDAILLDIGLPKLNGYEVCRAIRAEVWGKKMVIVALTGWGQEEDRRKSDAAGFNSHVVKPVEPAELGRLLAQLLARTPGA